MFKSWVRKYLRLYAENICLSKPVILYLQATQTVHHSPLLKVDFLNAVSILCQNGVGNLLDDWFFEELQRDLRNRVAPAFWAFFAGTCAGLKNYKIIKVL